MDCYLKKFKAIEHKEADSSVRRKDASENNDFFVLKLLNRLYDYLKSDPSKNQILTKEEYDEKIKKFNKYMQLKIKAAELEQEIFS